MNRMKARTIFKRSETDDELRQRCHKKHGPYGDMVRMLNDARGTDLDFLANGMGLSRRIVEDER